MFTPELLCALTIQEGEKILLWFMSTIAAPTESVGQGFTGDCLPLGPVKG